METFEMETKTTFGIELIGGGVEIINRPIPPIQPKLDKVHEFCKTIAPHPDSAIQ